MNKLKVLQKIDEQDIIILNSVLSMIITCISTIISSFIF